MEAGEGISKVMPESAAAAVESTSREVAKAIADFGPQKKPKRNKFAFACATLASMSCILMGYDIGVMSGATLYIKKDWKVSDVQIEVLMGILNLCCLLGSAVAGKTSDWIGRCYTIVFASVIFSIGALLMGFATCYAFLVLGIVVAGISVGYFFIIAPVYTAEVSPASSRGFLSSFPELFFSIGILLGYVSNIAFSKLPLHLSWRVMLGIGVVPSVLLTLGVLAMPESPRWLVMKGRLGDAKKVLSRTSGSPEEAALRLSEIKEAAGVPPEWDDDVVTIPKSEKSKGEGVWKELLINPTPTVKRVLIAGIGVQFFQQCCGIAAIVFYSPRIFEKAGMTNDTHKLLATVGVGFVKTIFVLVPAFTLDKYGRRPLLLTSVGGIILSLLTMAVSLTIIDHSHHKQTWAVAVCIAMVCVYVASYSIGLGPIPAIYSSEIFPLRLRAQGVSMGMVVNRGLCGVVTLTFLSLSKAITIGGAFFLFLGMAIMAWLFFFTFLPETQRRTLEEMNQLFDDFRWKESLNINKGQNKDGED